jgi:hypothetical protein
MSKRTALLLAAERLEDRNTPSPEFVKLVQFVERNSPQWHRKRRRTSDELEIDLVRKIERNERHKLLDAIDIETQENSGEKLQ